MSGSDKISFPLSRIRMIMKSTPEVSNIGQDAVMTTAKAAEFFVTFLADEALKRSKNSRKIEYSDIVNVVHMQPNLDFLYDIIPQKTLFRDYMRVLEQVKNDERQLLKDAEV